MESLSEWNRIDAETGLVQCWFSHGALDKIMEMDLSDKIVWMWGSGRGDTWLAKRCKKLYVVERRHEWVYASEELQKANGVTNVEYVIRSCNEGSGAQDFYCEIPEGVRPDVFIVDDVYRYECILKALEFKPCTLIVDNWMQDYVFICPSAEEILKKYNGEIFPQLDHNNHEGNCWKTAIWYIK